MYTTYPALKAEALFFRGIHQLREKTEGAFDTLKALQSTIATNDIGVGCPLWRLRVVLLEMTLAATMDMPNKWEVFTGRARDAEECLADLAQALLTPELVQSRFPQYSDFVMVISLGYIALRHLWKEALPTRKRKNTPAEAENAKKACDSLNTSWKNFTIEIKNILE